MPKVVLDRHIREVLHRFVRPIATADSGVIIDELTLASVDGRVDVAIVGDNLRGYEIKSDGDSLTRLPREMTNYAMVMDYLTVVVTKKHLSGAQKMLPAFWGVCVYDGGSITELRDAKPHLGQSKERMAELLWRDRAEALLEKHGSMKGLLTKPKRVIAKRISETCDYAQIRSALIEQYKDHRRQHRSVVRGEKENWASY